MTETRQKAKENFEIKSYEIDRKINQILFALDNSDDVEVLEAHMLLISSHLEQYRELQMKGIDVLPIDYNGLYAVQCALFNKLFDLY